MPAQSRVGLDHQHTVSIEFHRSEAGTNRLETPADTEVDPFALRVYTKIDQVS